MLSVFIIRKQIRVLSSVWLQGRANVFIVPRFVVSFCTTVSSSITTTRSLHILIFILARFLCQGTKNTTSDFSNGLRPEPSEGEK